MSYLASGDSVILHLAGPHAGDAKAPIDELTCRRTRACIDVTDGEHARSGRRHGGHVAPRGGHYVVRRDGLHGPIEAIVRVVVEVLLHALAEDLRLRARAMGAERSHHSVGDLHAIDLTMHVDEPVPRIVREEAPATARVVRLVHGVDEPAAGVVARLARHRAHPCIDGLDVEFDRRLHLDARSRRRSTVRE